MRAIKLLDLAPLMPAVRLGLLALALTLAGCPRPAPPPPAPPIPSALAITTLRLPPAEVGVGYRAQLSAVGGVRPYIWSAAGLPAGLALSVGGQLGGTPVAAGAGTFTVRVADSAALLQHTDDSTSARLVLVAARDRVQSPPSQSSPTSPPPPPCTDTLGRRVKDAAGVPITGCGGGEIQGGLVIVIGSAAPVVSGVSPTFGPTTGGTALTISGVNFRPGATVTIGSNACLSVVVVSANQITCITSAGTAGLVGLTVTNADGTSFLLASAYSYQSGPVPPTDTGSPLVANNTSACGGSPLQSYCTTVFPGMIDAVDVGVATPTFNATTANVSKLDVHRLLPPGTFACVHFMAWFHSPGTGDHTQTKYNSNDTATVAGQMSDIESNGFQCVIIDWYSSLSTTEDGTTQKVRDNLAASGKAKFAVMEDQGAITHSGDHNCAVTDHACVIAAAETDLCYMNAVYFPSSAYLSIDPVSRLPVASGHPAVYTFPPSGGWSNTDWATIRTYAQNLSANCSTVGHGSNNGPVNFIDQDNAGFTNPPWAGAFSWVSTSPYGISAQFNIDGSSGTYHESFYNNCKSHPSQICFGSAKKGFNDNGASWGLDRVVDQECGQTWVLTLRKAPTGIAGLGLQGVTWNDYEEGTELESGIRSCYGQNAATVTGNTFAWSASTSNGTYAPTSAGVPTGPQMDHWAVWAVDGSGNPQSVASLPLTILSLDLTTVCIPAGSWTMYAQLVGQPRIDNVLSNGVSYTSAGAGCPAAAVPTTAIGTNWSTNDPCSTPANSPWPIDFANFGVLRIWQEAARWSNLETARGTYVWTHLDCVLAKAAALSVPPALEYTIGSPPTWSNGTAGVTTLPTDVTTGGACTSIPSAFRTLAGLQSNDCQFQEFMYNLAMHVCTGCNPGASVYTGTLAIKYWSTGNEVNISDFVTLPCKSGQNPTTCQHLAIMSRDAYLILHAVDSTVIVGTPSTTTNTGYNDLNAYLQTTAQGFHPGDYADALVHHCYLNGYSVAGMPENGSAHVNGLASTAQNMLTGYTALLTAANHMSVKPVYCDEGGYGNNFQSYDLGATNTLCGTLTAPVTGSSCIDIHDIVNRSVNSTLNAPAAGFLARSYLWMLAKGYSGFDWFAPGADDQGSTAEYGPAGCTVGVTCAYTRQASKFAFDSVYNWIVGSTLGSLTNPSGTQYRYTLTGKTGNEGCGGAAAGGGYTAVIAWDTVSTSTVSCGGFGHYCTLFEGAAAPYSAGALHACSGSVTVGPNPVLLEP